MNASRNGVDHTRKLVGVGGLELREPTPLKQGFGKWIVLGQGFKHIFVGGRRALGCFLNRLVAELLEKNVTELLGRAQIKGLACKLMGLHLKRGNGLGKLVALVVQLLGVNKNAGFFHINKREHGGDLDGLVDKPKLFFGLNLRPQGLVQVQGEIGVFAGILAGLGDIDLAKVDS